MLKQVNKHDEINLGNHHSICINIADKMISTCSQNGQAEHKTTELSSSMTANHGRSSKQQPALDKAPVPPFFSTRLT
jgi:hypothetical protein